MNRASVAATVREIVTPMANELGLNVWEVTFQKEGTNRILRVCVERKDGEFVSTKDCESLSKPLSAKLDDLDPIDCSYFLEVSSPGLGRKLKNKEQLNSKLGFDVTVKLIRPLGLQREFKGVLKEVDGNKFFLEGIDAEFDIKQCSYVKLNDDLNLFDNNK